MVLLLNYEFSEAVQRSHWGGAHKWRCNHLFCHSPQSPALGWNWKDDVLNGYDLDLIHILGLVHLGVIVSPPAPSIKPELKLAVTKTTAKHIHRDVLCHSQPINIRSTLIQNYWKRVTHVSSLVSTYRHWRCSGRQQAKSQGVEQLHGDDIAT